MIHSLINYTGTWNGGLFTLGGNELADDEEFTFFPEPPAALLGALSLLLFLRRKVYSRHPVGHNPPN